MIQVTDSTETAIFRARATEMNEALVVSAVRQHELIDTIRQGEQKRRELEVQMFQAKKMESLGLLAGGIAHDLNNMLTPVVGFAELASRALPVGSPVAPMLEAVGINARRAADLVQQILAYAGKGQFVIESVDLSALVSDMAGLLGAAASIGTELKYELTPALPAVEADATQLRQVVMNLVTNASEAVAGRGGTITVRTGLVATAPPLPESDSRKEPAVFLEVADTGCGMTADVMEKIFDPFFSTKFIGRGLGLAVVQGIARGHHGVLQVCSEPGKGSTFRLVLPASTQPAVASVASRSSEEWRGTGTVLVIDDELQVRDIATRILKHAGLTSLVASDGLEGLRVFHDHKQEIAAVVLDLTMPRMSGLEVAEKLHEVRPDLPVVLMSGFSAETVTQQSADLGITGVVQKPFTVSDLLAAVRLALGQ
jgi:signal transduction histidine kinase